MQKFILSMEATCDLPKELIKKYDFKVIDMNFMVGEQSFCTDKDDVVTSNLYSKMKEGIKPRTSQVNDYAYEEFFVKLLNEDKPIIHLSFTSGLSQTCDVAKRVADKLNAINKTKIYVIDTLCGCLGQGYLAILVHNFMQKANSVEEVLNYIESIKLRICHIFTLDNLKYLANGGRIKSSVAFVGNMLNIKPIIKLENNGKLNLSNKVLSRKKSLLTLCDIFNKTRSEESICIVGHADSATDAKFVADTIKSTGSDAIIANIGPILGCHCGPSTVAIFYLSKEGR